jgi:Ethanolamine utilization protein EutJ (predicted chaperonin)
VESSVLLLEKHRDLETIQDVLTCLEDAKQTVIALTADFSKAVRDGLVGEIVQCAAKVGKKGASEKVQVAALQRLSNECSAAMEQAYRGVWKEMAPYIGSRLEKLLK